MHADKKEAYLCTASYASTVCYVSYTVHRYARHRKEQRQLEKLALAANAALQKGVKFIN